MTVVRVLKKSLEEMTTKELAIRITIYLGLFALLTSFIIGFLIGVLVE